ncbi:MAG: hypothetical protein KME05_08660 [Gloeocapsa sp. UFS-A4-WI-NPMV-4B04]|nr:hypothetical protein [Gloeocapsa sp. UFS-A4-WI-NPMV-4B04]
MSAFKVQSVHSSPNRVYTTVKPTRIKTWYVDFFAGVNVTQQVGFK